MSLLHPDSGSDVEDVDGDLHNKRKRNAGEHSSGESDEERSQNLEETETNNTEEQMETNHTEDEINQDGAREAFEMLKPFVICPDQYPALKDRLASLGVTNLSHIRLLKENDFDGIITPMQFRSMQQNFQSKNTNSDHLNPSGGSSVRYKLDLKSLLNLSLYQTLVADKEILTKQNRRKLIALIGDNMEENLCVIRQKEVLKVSTALVRAHPTSLGCLMKDEIDIKEASSVLCSSLLGHIYYKRSSEKTSKSSKNNGAAKRTKFSNAQCNGLEPERDLPNCLPEGETPETQESKRRLMVEWAKSGSPVKWTSVTKMMGETYFSQRGDINAQLSMDKILARWPFIGKHSILQAHFETLKNFNVAEGIKEASGLSQGLEKFFKAESYKVRKGKCAKIPGRLKEILKNYYDGEDTASRHFISILMCCLVYMDVPENEMFVFFEETASFDEVQASEKIPPHPIIAVLGNDVQDNPHAYILVDKCIISEYQITLSKAINALFMCYYVFKIAYPRRGAPILHFIQRKVFGILDDGTKTQRTKTKSGYVGVPPPVPNQLLTLMKNFKAYCSEWNEEF